MAQESQIKKVIPKIYKRDTLTHLMFAHVNATRHNIPGSTIEAAVEQFKKYYGLSEADYPTQTAIRTFHAMTKELYDSQKSTSD